MVPDTEINDISGLTKPQRASLKRSGIETVRDLLFYFPYRYDDFGEAIEVVDCVPGSLVYVVTEVKKVRSRRSFRRRMTMTEAVLGDDSGEITALWFNQPYLSKYLETGKRYRFVGKVTKTKFGLRLITPLYEAEDAEGSRSVTRFVPVYSSIPGVSQHALRKLIRRCGPAIDQMEDSLDERIRSKYGLLPMKEVLHSVHFPEDLAGRDKAMKRIGFEEVLKFQLIMGRNRLRHRASKATRVPFDEEKTKRFVEALPYQLTDDQRKAAWEVFRDIAQDTPMLRLLNGDVGSGKTVVAALAALNVHEAGHQSALMAPTEILASQHFETLKDLYQDAGIDIALWTNSYKRAATGGRVIDCAGREGEAGLKERIIAGEITVVVGTHALIQDKFRFASLALAIIDEQHRFGVGSRHLLYRKGLAGREPHLLSMTATPIPRSLALTIYGDLDLSVLREKPKGRRPVKTKIYPPRRTKDAYEIIREQVAAGRQAFVVCPLIDPSDSLGVSSVTELADRLGKKELVGLEIGILHGKMAAEDKETVMRDFVQGKTDVLISTSVVEVGVDVPNASVMCIEGAERFGLAQLHQFRGRVGRGEHDSYCLLLPTSETEAVLARLRVMSEVDDGFEVAEKDLEMRGHGELLGEAQSGYRGLSAVSLGDIELIRQARQAAADILKDDPDLSGYPGISASIDKELEEVHLE